MSTSRTPFCCSRPDPRFTRRASVGVCASACTSTGAVATPSLPRTQTCGRWGCRNNDCVAVTADVPFDSEPKRAWSENFSGAHLDPAENTLRVIKTGGTGDISLSDFKVDYKTL
jgi:hypothetical protein